MDILLTRYRTPQSRLVEYLTGSYWTHISAAINGTVYDFNLNGKRVSNIEDFCNKTRPSDIDIVRGSSIDEQLFLNDFENAKYEDVKGLLRIVNKYRKGRCLENIATSDRHYTCSSLVGKQLILPHHYSQTIPSDFKYHQS